MMKRDPDTLPENTPSTFGEFEDDFDYFDDHPEDDPFMPKPTCFHCEGAGVITLNDREFTCTFCGGSGALK